MRELCLPMGLEPEDLKQVDAVLGARIKLKKGDRVLFGKWSGTEVKIDGQELIIMKESDIMGVLEK